MINVVIFSKDRPAQLELLLRSMKKYFVEWKLVNISILFKYTSENFRKGYEKTKIYHSEFNYVVEEPDKFKSQVVNLIKPNHQATMFFADDMVFKKYFCLKSTPIKKFLEDDNIICVALMLCPRIDYCGKEKIKTPPPKFTLDRMWFWKDPNFKGCWSTPMGLNGNVLKTDDILPLIKNFYYEDTNTLENILIKNSISKPYMICYPEAPLFNMPLNRTKDNNNGYCGNVPLEYLNEQFLNLKRISMSNIDLTSNISCHQEMPIILEDSVTYPFSVFINIISKNKINYFDIIFDSRFYKKVKEEISDITLLVPVKDRTKFLKPFIHYVKEAQNSYTSKIKIIIIENDNSSRFKNICEELDIDYIFIPIDACQSNGFFAKSLCYNIGFLLAPKTQWYIFHDLDILVNKDYFVKINQYLNKNPEWIQPYTKKRIRLLSDKITDSICSGNFMELSSIPEKEAPTANPGSTGGSIVVRRDAFEDVGGYDPEIFYGYAPEDSFFWTKLEINNRKIDHINSPFQGGAVYADAPPIEVYHMNHPIMEKSNPYHTKMRSILESFYAYQYEDKIKIIDFKKKLLKI